MKFLLQTMMIAISLLAISSCSFKSLPAPFTSFFIKHSIASLNSETDLKKVKNQLPKNIASLEQVITANKDNQKLHIYAAQAYYSFAFSFVEDNNIDEAIYLYSQSYQHAKHALSLHGVFHSDLQGDVKQLAYKVDLLSEESVSALYWTALSWAKLIEISQPNFLMFVQLYKTSILMRRVVKLDDSYHFYGASLFFAVYYGSRPTYLGGSQFVSRQYFERARKLNKNRLLMVDFLEAKYLKGRGVQENVLHRKLYDIINAPDDLYPEQALMNAVAKQKASHLLMSRHG